MTIYSNAIIINYYKIIDFLAGQKISKLLTVCVLCVYVCVGVYLCIPN